MSERPMRIGVVGLGMMGLTHLDVYTQLPGVQVVAIADRDEDRLTGRVRATGNIDGQAASRFDYGAVGKYADGLELIRAADVDVVDVCLPTRLHAKYAKAALSAGRHVLVEKPVAWTAAEADDLARVAAGSDCYLMVAMCMRFWPGWDWLKAAVEDRQFGAVRSAQFRRVAAHPGGAFYADGEQCGGAILDLHVHDTDFVCHLFGRPAAVSSVGHVGPTGRTDYVHTHYHYEGGPVVTAEGGWAMAGGFPFTMQYAVNFADATAVFDLAAAAPLTVYRDGHAETVPLAEGMGYRYEIEYFLDCVRRGERPQRVSAADAAAAIHVVEAEMRSVATGQRVAVPAELERPAVMLPGLTKRVAAHV